MTRVAVNGVHLNVETWGDGPPLVLLHGFTGDASTWAPFAEAFGSIRTMVAVDLLGHGRSDSPPHAGRYRIERCIEDLAALFEHLGVEGYDLLGYSMGGRAALHLALAQPERVRALILESASPGIEGAEEREARRQQDERLAQLLAREGTESFVDRWERLPLFASQRRLDGETRAALRRQRLAANPIGLAGSLRGFGAGVPEPLYGRLAELPAPLLIAGELDDRYCRLACSMADLIPGASPAIVPEAGHAVHLERPQAFEEIVMSFLRKSKESELERTTRDRSMGDRPRVLGHQV